MYRWRWYILFLLILANVLIWFGAHSYTTPDVLTVSFLDIGQGDATLIESTRGAQVLVDGGPGRSIVHELGRAMGFFDRSIDVVIATHPDKDHIGGLPDVLDMYNVSYILDPGVSSDTATYKTFRAAAQAEPSPQLVCARRGQVINLGDGIYLRVLFPDRDVTHVESNSGSIIVQLVYKDTTFLLTGDAPIAVENYVSMLDWTTLQSDVLKAGHHGSRTSSSEQFVGLASPEYAVISRGCNNRYGHPHKEVVALLERFEARILDTCAEGTIVFESNGDRVTLR